MKKLLFISISLFLFPVFNLIAAEDETELPEPEVKWFQIEIIVFERSDPNRFTEETWPEDPLLPEITGAIDFLTPVPEIEIPLLLEKVNEEQSDQIANLDKNKLSTQIDNFESNPSSDLNQGSTEVIQNSQVDVESDATNAGTALFSTQDIVLNSLKVEEGKAPVFETPFVEVEPEQRGLIREADIFKRNKHLKILLHTAWRQPVNDEDNADPVRLLGGEDFAKEYDKLGHKIDPSEINEPTNSADPGFAIDDLNSSPIDAADNLSETISEDMTSNQSSNILTENCVPVKLNEDLQQTDLTTEQGTLITEQGTTEPDLQENINLNADFPSTSSAPTIGDPTIDDLTIEKSATKDSVEAHLADHLARNDDLLPPCSSTLVPESIFHLWQLDGKITVHVKRYLHINLNLVYRHPGQKLVDIYQLDRIGTEIFNEKATEEKSWQLLDWQAPASTDIYSLEGETESSKVTIDILKSYVINQSKRVKSQEIHYFDHPLIGVLTLITPYQPQLAPEEEITETELASEKIASETAPAPDSETSGINIPLKP